MKTLIRTIFFVVFSPIIIIVIGHFIGPIVIATLYPRYYNIAVDLFYILNVAFGLLSVDYILRGFIIKFYPEFLKMIIDIASTLLLIGFIFILSEQFGLTGVAYGILVTYFIKATINMILLVIYFLNSLK